MNSGRSPRSGSVVASSRAKRVKAEPVVLSSRSVLQPAALAEQPLAVELELGDAVLAVAEREQLPAPAHRRERQLARAQPQRLHLLVGVEEAAAERGEEGLRHGIGVLERVAQDHVLHRVRGHDGAVVALRVGGHEGLAEHLHAHLPGEQAGVERPDRRLRDLGQPAQGRDADAVHGHRELAVRDPGHGPSSRSSRRNRAILAISASAVRSSSSGAGAGARLGGGDDRVRRVLAGADDEREAEALVVRGGERGDPLVLRRREPVEPGGRLLARRLRADARLRAEVGVRADQRRGAPSRRRLGHHRDHRGVQVGDRRERPPLPRGGGDPRRVLEHAAEALGERVAVEPAGGGRVHGTARYPGRPIAAAAGSGRQAGR